MTKRGRPFRQWPRQHIRVSAERQELLAIYEAVPDTRQRAIILLAMPTLIEALQEIDENIATGQYERARLLTADIRTLLEGERKGDRNE